MNLVAVHGLGSLGDSDVVSNETTTCMPNEKWEARMDSYNSALSQLSKAKSQRWLFLAGGAVFGALATMIIMRSR